MPMMSEETITSLVVARRTRRPQPSSAALTALDRDGLALDGPPSRIVVEPVAGRHALGGADQLAVQLRDDQADRLGGAGAVRDDVLRHRRERGAGRPCAAGRPESSDRPCRRARCVIDAADSIGARLIPGRFAIGARQFVVQEAAEMILSSRFVSVFSFTLYTIVGRSLPAGAEMTTFFAPASMCAWALCLAGIEAGALQDDVHVRACPRAGQQRWASL